MRLRVFLSGLLLTGLLIAGPFSAFAQTTIAVVDVEYLLTESKAAKHINAQIESRRKAFLEELSEKEQSLKEMEEKLIESQEKGDAEGFESLRKRFEEEYQQTSTFARQTRGALESSFGKAMNKLRTNMFEITQEIAEEKNYDLVLAQQTVVIGHKSLSITEEVLERLDNKISKIELE